MELRIKTAATSEPVSTDLVKQFIKFAYGTDTDEVSLLEHLIKAVRTHIEKIAGISLTEKTYEVRFDSFDSEEIHHSPVTQEPQAAGFTLPVAPVVSVVNVATVYKGAETTVSYIEKGNYNRMIIYSLAKESQLKVEFKAGYGDNSEECPEDIKQAIIKQVARWYWNRQDYMEGAFIDDFSKIVNRYKTSVL